MKKIYKILKFMKQNRKVFYFFNVKYERGIIAKDKNGNPILLDGEDLDDLKKFINMDNSSKIQNMLKDLFEKRKRPTCSFVQDSWSVFCNFSTLKRRA